MQGLIRTIVALALMALVGEPARAQQSEAQSILNSIVAKTRDIGKVCMNRGLPYYCVFLESASLRAGKLRARVEEAARNPHREFPVEFYEVEVSLQSVYPRIERPGSGVHLLFLACNAGNCINERTPDGKLVRRDSSAMAGSVEPNTKPIEETLRLFERLIALCSESSC